jgi:hypothetical protein
MRLKDKVARVKGAGTGSGRSSRSYSPEEGTSA